MSSRLVGILWGACLLSVSPHPAGAAGTDDEAIMAADRAFYEAFSSRDIAAMKAVWADKPYAANIGPRSKEVTIGYASVVAYWSSTFETFSKVSVAPSNMHVQSDGKLAWIVGNETAELQPASGGNPLKFETFVTQVFEKDGEKWLLVSHHANTVPK
jgi:ketosteroid isomerase-like protein